MPLFSCRGANLVTSINVNTETDLSLSLSRALSFLRCAGDLLPPHLFYASVADRLPASV